MTNIKTILFLIFCPVLLIGQNIIPNGSFIETYQASFGATNAIDWESPTNGSPDFMHPKSIAMWDVPYNYVGFQNAKKGQGYYGISTFSKTKNNVREYIQSKLVRSLKKDSVYCFQMYISLEDSIRYATSNSLEILFSSQKISNQNSDLINSLPNISFYDSTYFDNKTSWIKVSREYTANGTEKYIVIGNFKNDSLIDTLMVNGGLKDYYDHAYYYVDDIFLGNCDSVPLDTSTGITENSFLSKFKGYPNPVKEQFTLENNSKQPLTFQLNNLQGSKIQVAVQQSNKKYSFSIGHLPKGIYLLQVIGENERATLKLIKD